MGIFFDVTHAFRASPQAYLLRKAILSAAKMYEILIYDDFEISNSKHLERISSILSSLSFGLPITGGDCDFLNEHVAEISKYLDMYLDRIDACFVLDIVAISNNHKEYAFMSPLREEFSEKDFSSVNFNETKKNITRVLRTVNKAYIFVRERLRSVDASSSSIFVDIASVLSLFTAFFVATSVLNGLSLLTQLGMDNPNKYFSISDFISSFLYDSVKCGAMALFYAATTCPGFLLIRDMYPFRMAKLLSMTRIFFYLAIAAGVIFIFISMIIKDESVLLHHSY